MATSKRKLDSGIDWKKLRHAQGPATSVPKQLAALTHGERDARDEAFFALNDTLYASNAWFSASEPAAAALLNVAFTGQEGSHRALWLMADIAAGNHETRLEALARQEAIAQPDFVARLASQHEAELLGSLQSSDGRTRSAAGFLLAFLPAVQGSSVPALVTAVGAESEPEVLASLVLALATLSVQGGSPFPSNGAQTSNNEPPLLSGARALGGLLSGVNLSSGTLEVAARGLLAAEFDSERFYWGHAREKLGAAERLLSLVARGRGLERDFSEVLLRIVEAPPSARVLDQAAALVLNLAGFKQRWPKETDVALVEELDERQLRMARAVATHEGVKLGWGLPPAARDRQRWLGLAAPGTLEKLVTVTVDGKPQRVPLWHAWRMPTERRVTLPPELYEQLSPRERFEALHEAALGGYAILRARPGFIDDDDITAEVNRAGKAIAEWVDWAEKFADEVARVFDEARLSSERGGQLQYPASVPLLLVPVRAGRSLRPEWDLLLAWPPCPENREVLSAVPVERREAAFYRKVLADASPSMDIPLQWLMPILDLVPSQRITEIVLAKLRNPYARSDLGADVADQHLARIAELAKTEPGIRAALDAEGAPS